MSDLLPGTPQSSGWVAVRCIFHSELDGTGMYEERVTLWRTSSMDEAVERAEAEAHEYAAILSTPPADPTEYVGLAQAYLLSDTPGDGAEVFSLIRGSDLEPEDYLDTFFDTGTERQHDVGDPAEPGEADTAPNRDNVKT
ncbi:hypothetical protein [Pseudokineococcus lusitanus]|uniref:DUF4288 domain-containing protein n=1 Tax=Pseudokineococcus lusitanus TaxID=763993 RepID=A0A3N1HQ81_9ACTN|nr:hypothetical protein [Pseudokineococcus lusitanus]ROP44674.1 hypothetical protein EDC03_0800 [Pseudokineococcus lusitanus]